MRQKIVNFNISLKKKVLYCTYLLSFYCTCTYTHVPRHHQAKQEVSLRASDHRHGQGSDGDVSCSVRQLLEHARPFTVHDGAPLAVSHAVAGGSTAGVERGGGRGATAGEYGVVWRSFIYLFIMVVIATCTIVITNIDIVA